MKKLIIAAVLMIGMTSFAQTTPGEKGHKTERLSPDQRNEKHLKKLTTELNLNEKQQKEIGAILAEQSSKREANKEERKAQMQANGAKIKAVLTPEQTKKWEELKAKKKEEFKEKRQENKDKKAKK